MAQRVFRDVLITRQAVVGTSNDTHIPTVTEMDPVWAAESNLGRILGVCATLHVCALAFVALRLYTRARIVRSFGVDDWLMLAAALCALLGGMVTIIIAAFHGLGRHTAAVSPADYVEYMKQNFIQAIVGYFACFLFLKTSVGFSLLRFGGTAGWYVRTIWAFMGFVVLYTVAAWVSLPLACRPTEAFWDTSLQGPGVCLSLNERKALALFNTVSNIVTDTAFATLPIPLIWSLHMRLKNRAYLVGILSLGYMYAFSSHKPTVGLTDQTPPDPSRPASQRQSASMYSAVTRTRACKPPFPHVPQPPTTSNTDTSPSTNWIQFFGFVQVNLAIIAACAPTLRPLVGDLLHISRSASNNRPRYNNNNNSGLFRLSSSRYKIRPPFGRGWVETTSGAGADVEMVTLSAGATRVGQKRASTTVRATSTSTSEEGMKPGAPMGMEERADGTGVTTMVEVSFSREAVQ